MTLSELSVSYRDSARRLRLRIRELRAEEASQADPEAAQRLRQRAAALVPL